MKGNYGDNGVKDCRSIKEKKKCCRSGKEPGGEDKDGGGKDDGAGGLPTSLHSAHPG